MYNLTFAENNNLYPGDVLIGPKSQFEIVKHYIVYIGKDNYGRDLFMDNNFRMGVRYILEHQLLKENPTSLEIRKFEGSDFDRSLAIQRAKSLVGKPYNLTDFNCEHLANYVQYNSPFSKQVDKGKEGLQLAAAFAGVLILFGLLSGK